MLNNQHRESFLSPQQVIRSEGELTIKPDTNIFVEKGRKEVLKTGRYLAELIRSATGYKIKVVETDQSNGIKHKILLITHGAEETLGSEGYKLSISPDQVVITAFSGAGLFYGVQSLRQLLPVEIDSRQVTANVSWAVPCVDIENFPRQSG